MCSWPSAVLGTLLLAAGVSSALARDAYPGIGRAATPAEVAAWDIDVRPDFKGLPPGSGTVAQGQLLYEARCASCHGVFGESNEFSTPLVGGTTAQDSASGRVAALADPAYPVRSTLMKLPTLATLWDYIRRAMPFKTPRSLQPDEVYALVAYLLHLGDLLPADAMLSDGNIAAVQQRLPNRHGMSTDHALWPGRPAVPDVRARRCLRDCGAFPSVASALPDSALPLHGNLAEQNRSVGAVHGVQTVPPPSPRPRP